MIHLVEFTSSTGTPILINSDTVVKVFPHPDGSTIHTLGPSFPAAVKEDFEEVRKRLSTPPKAQTLAKI